MHDDTLTLTQHLIIQFFHLRLEPLHPRVIWAILVDSIGVLYRKIGAPLAHARQEVIIPNLRDRIDIAGQLAGRHVVNKSLYLNNKTILPGYILSALGDRVEMAHSIEARLPFLDHHVVEYTRKLPVSLKIRDTTEKFVLREAMKPMLTPTVYIRQKHPFLSPPALLKPEEPLHALLQDTLRGRALDRVPYLRREGVIDFLDQAAGLELTAKIAAEFPLMLMLSSCLLAERFGL